MSGLILGLKDAAALARAYAESQRAAVRAVKAQGKYSEAGVLQAGADAVEAFARVLDSKAEREITDKITVVVCARCGAQNPE